MKDAIMKYASIALLLCLMIPFISNSILSIDIDAINDTVISDELITISNINDANFIDDEVIIMLADNEQTETMGFYSVYYRI